MSYTAPDIMVRLRKRFEDTRQFVLVEEVYLGTAGYGRRIDAIAFNAYSSKSQYLEGIEVKVSKADLRKELADPKKHTCFYENLDFFSLACPAELLTKDMLDAIPSTWGLYVPHDDGLKAKRRPLALHDSMAPTIKRDFAVSLMRRMQGRSPAKAELDRAYQEGRERERFENELKKPSRTKRLETENATYKAFFDAAGIEEFWSDDRARKVGQATKAARELDSLDSHCRSIVRAIDGLEEAKAAIEDMMGTEARA